MRTLGVAIGFIAIFAILTAPALAAGTGIWEDTGCAADSTSGGPTSPCDFCDALIVVRNVTVMLTWFSTIAATLMIVVGALMMMLAAGSEERFAKGKTTILNAVIGMAIALTAWLFVNVVLQFLSGNPDLPWNTINCT